MRYHHYFDVRIGNDFHSDIEDFEEALKAWVKKFKSPSALRARLFNSSEETATIVANIEFSETLDADGELVHPPLIPD